MEFVKKKWSVIVIGFLVLIGSLRIISYLVHLIVNMDVNIRAYWFETGNGNHFQWVGITAILAVIGFIVNIIWSNKNFNAELKAKSRIDWMKTVRNNYSEFLTVADTLRFKLVQRDDSRKNIARGEIESVYRELIKSRNTILLYVPERSNELIVGNVNKIFDELSEIERNKRARFRHTITNEQVKKDIANATLQGAEYFKKEWERAKKGA